MSRRPRVRRRRDFARRFRAPAPQRLQATHRAPTNGAAHSNHEAGYSMGHCPRGQRRINILNASIEAMHRALDALTVRPGAVIVDGNRFKPYRDLPCTTFVKGDGRFANIAAASVLAKTERDLYMVRAHESYPEYCWNVNKGYPTADHRRAIAEHGPTPLHRMSFRLLAQPTLPGL